MELRYVYRRVEDAIGVPLNEANSPHLSITKKLRLDFRELRDFARHSEVTAICLASLTGNPEIDVEKMHERVSDVLSIALDRKMPYLKIIEQEEEKKRNKKDKYAEYFKQLEAFKKELEEKKPSDSTVPDNTKEDLVR